MGLVDVRALPLWKVRLSLKRNHFPLKGIGEESTWIVREKNARSAEARLMLSMQVGDWMAVRIHKDYKVTVEAQEDE